MLEADVEVDRREFTVRAAFSVAPGERLALFGPSGAGKTTVLEVIAGLVPPRRGSVVLAGRVLTRTGAPACAVPPWQRKVGLLRQDPALFPHLTVRQNLAYAPGAASRGEEIGELADRLEIASLLDARPVRLSGGQAHRVALGRLLISHCDALLLDEPYTGLDASLRRALTALVRELVAARQVPSVLVAHELSAAQAFADRLAVLDRGEVLQVGTPAEVVAGPAQRRVAELVGYQSFVPLTAFPWSREAPPEGVSRGAIDPGGSRGSSPWASTAWSREAPPEGVSRGAIDPGGSRGSSPWASTAGAVAGVHPERVVAGAHPGRGLVLGGPVRSCHPSGAGWEVEIETRGTVITLQLADRPAERGEDIVVTVLDPPCFSPDGMLLPRAEQARA